MKRYLSPCSDQLQLLERGESHGVYTIKNNETSLPELFHNYLFLRFLQKEKLVGSKFRYAFCHCFLFFSFFCYLFFGHHSEWHYNAVNFTIDRILSRVKKQYSRVINKLIPTAFSVSKQEFVKNSNYLNCMYELLYLFPQILQGPSGTFGLQMLREEKRVNVIIISHVRNITI